MTVIRIVTAGPQGASAYQSWLNLGNTGTEQDFIDSLGAHGIQENIQAPILTDVKDGEAFSLSNGLWTEDITGSTKVLKLNGVTLTAPWIKKAGMRGVLQGYITVGDVTVPSNPIFLSNNQMDGPYMFGYTHCKPNYFNPVQAQPATKYKLTKIHYYAPQYLTNNFRFHYGGYLCNGGVAPTENIFGQSPCQIDNVWVSPDNGVTLYPVKFKNANGVKVMPNTVGEWTDNLKLPNDIAPEGRLTVFTLYHVEDYEMSMTSYQLQAHNGERVWAGATKAEALTYLTAGAPDTVSDIRVWDQEDLVNYGQNQPAFYGPDMIVSKGWDGRPVALVTADSIGESRQEYSRSADNRGNLGWLRRFLDKDGPLGRTPFWFIGMPGVTTARELQGNSGKRWDLVDQVKDMNGGFLPFTFWIDQMGNNDLGGTLASYITAQNSFKQKVRNRWGQWLRVIKAPIMAQNSTSDNFTTAAGQTNSGTNAYPGGQRYQVMDYTLLSASNGFADDVINNRDAWSDPISKGAFATRFHSALTLDQMGTDGTTVYTNPFRLEDDHPFIADDIIVACDVNTGAVFAQFDVLRVNGPYVYYRQTNRNAIIPAGSIIYGRPSPDGLHPTSNLARYAADNVPQTEKAKFYYGPSSQLDLSDFSFLGSRSGAYIKAPLTALKG